MIAIVFVFIMIQVSSFYSWFGGNAVGPRYLAPALPFLGLAAAYGIKRFPIPVWRSPCFRLCSWRWCRPWRSIRRRTC